MTINRTIALLTTILLSLAIQSSYACSMYKITVNGKTMVGCNEDAWRTTSTICFKNAKHLKEFGIAYTGSRQVSGNRIAPQSGMNEAGLTFSRLASYHPVQPNPFKDRLPIIDEVKYLEEILHKCATVREVKNHIEQYDHSIFIDDVYLYIDKSGNYLIVEPYTLTVGNDANYVLANFCPSITNNETARNQERFRNGQDYLKNHQAVASLSFCKSLSDTMHVCRSRNGDGTLLTSIWNPENGSVNLFFYHEYDTTVQFNLKEELLLGDRSLYVPDLFPENPEFNRLIEYKTPFNVVEMRLTLVGIGAILTLFSFLLLINAIRKKGVTIKGVFPLILMNLILIAYMFVLATNIGVYYFDAPYTFNGFSWITLSSYTPFILLLAFFPFTSYSVKHLQSVHLNSWIKTILVSNNLIFLILLFGFGYWGLFSFWN